LSELRPEDLPGALDNTRRTILVDLGRLWLRQSDLRFGQMLREAASKPVRRPTDLTDEAIREGLPAALARFPERSPAVGPYWDTETQGDGSFLKGRPRDPARIPLVLKAFGDAWIKYPHLSLAQLLDFALEQAGIPNTNTGTRWLLIEDGPMRRILQDLVDESGGPPPAPAHGPQPEAGSRGSERDRFIAALRDSRGGLLDDERFHDWVVAHGDLVWSGFPQSTRRRYSTVPRPGPVIVLHAGAFAEIEEPGIREHYRAILDAALSNGQLMLESGHDAVAVVHSVLWVMETPEFCNLYLGAPLCSDGSAHLSAAIMRGSDRAAAAIAGVRHVKHPITTAKLMLDDEEVVMLVGEAADRHAADFGVERIDNEYFINERQIAKLAAGVGSRDCATIGAVCLDATGGLAAGTSSGGLRDQPAGRVGAASLIGAGTWADSRVAISCAGDGEAFIRSGTARHIATLVECGTELEQAVQMAIADLEQLVSRV
jgi:beta-aspartyl-peptidase (threonine type)